MLEDALEVLPLVDEAAGEEPGTAHLNRAPSCRRAPDGGHRRTGQLVYGPGTDRQPFLAVVLRAGLETSTGFHR